MHGCLVLYIALFVLEVTVVAAMVWSNFLLFIYIYVTVSKCIYLFIRTDAY